MKTYFADIIPRIEQFSHKLDNLTLLTNKHWLLLDELENSKIVFIFRDKNELLISRNGNVEKAKWEYLNSNSILIDQKNSSLLFRHGFFDNNFLILKIDSRTEYAFLVNEDFISSKTNSVDKIIEFLKNKYLNSPHSVDARRSVVKKDPTADFWTSRDGLIFYIFIGAAFCSLIYCLLHIKELQ